VSAGRLSAACGAVLAGVAAALWLPVDFLRAWLIAWSFWTGLSLGCLAVLMLHHLVGGEWGLLVRRMLEAGASLLPALALGVVPVLLGVRALYPWLPADEAAERSRELAEKRFFLNLPFFVVRNVVYFAYWSLCASLLVRWSREEDRTRDPAVTERMRRFAGPALVGLVLTASFASMDWLMSLDPHWHSVAYGALVLVGDALTALTLVIVVLAWKGRSGPLAERTERQHVHDLGNLLLTFVMLWAYVAFSQFLVIWSGNLPEDRTWVHARMQAGWGWVALGLLALHFVAPFFLLLLRDVKRRLPRLAAVAGALAVLRVVDRVWLVAPSFEPHGAVLLLLTALCFAALGVLFYLGFTWRLAAAPVLPLAHLGRREEGARGG